MSLRLHLHVRWIFHRDLNKIELHSLGFLSIITSSVRRRLTRFFARLPSILSFIGVPRNSEILQDQFTVILRGIGEELHQRCSSLRSDQFKLSHRPSASAFDRLDEEPLARRWTASINRIHCSGESFERDSLSPHCSFSEAERKTSHNCFFGLLPEDRWSAMNESLSCDVMSSLKTMEISQMENQIKHRQFCFPSLSVLYQLLAFVSINHPVFVISAWFQNFVNYEWEKWGCW